MCWMNEYVLFLLNYTVFWCFSAWFLQFFLVQVALRLDIICECLSDTYCLLKISDSMGSGRTASCFPVLCVVGELFTGGMDGELRAQKRAQTWPALWDRRLSAVLFQHGSFHMNLYSLFPPQTFSSLRSPWLSREDHWVHLLSLCLSLCLHPGSLSVGLLGQCQTIHGRDRNCTPLQLPPEWITTLLFIVLGIISLTVTCGLMAISRCHCEASRYARWIAFAGSTCSHSYLHSQWTLICQHVKSLSRKEKWKRTARTNGVRDLHKQLTVRFQESFYLVIPNI